jgi:hypothetical protein
MMLRNKHVNMSVSLWTWAYEQEWIFLECFDDVDKIFLKYPYAT